MIITSGFKVLLSRFLKQSYRMRSGLRQTPIGVSNPVGFIRAIAFTASSAENPAAHVDGAF